MHELEQRIKMLEDKVKVLEEALDALRKMQISEQMSSYIRNRTRT